MQGDEEQEFHDVSGGAQQGHDVAHNEEEQAAAVAVHQQQELNGGMNATETAEMNEAQQQQYYYYQQQQQHVTDQHQAALAQQEYQPNQQQQQQMYYYQQQQQEDPPAATTSLDQQQHQQQPSAAGYGANNNQQRQPAETVVNGQHSPPPAAGSAEDDETSVPAATKVKEERLSRALYAHEIPDIQKELKQQCPVFRSYKNSKVEAGYIEFLYESRALWLFMALMLSGIANVAGVTIGDTITGGAYWAQLLTGLLSLMCGVFVLIVLVLKIPKKLPKWLRRGWRRKGTRGTKKEGRSGDAFNLYSAKKKKKKQDGKSEEGSTAASSAQSHSDEDDDEEDEELAVAAVAREDEGAVASPTATTANGTTEKEGVDNQVVGADVKPASEAQSDNDNVTAITRSQLTEKLGLAFQILTCVYPTIIYVHRKSCVDYTEKDAEATDRDVQLCYDRIDPYVLLQMMGLFIGGWRPICVVPFLFLDTFLYGMGRLVAFTGTEEAYWFGMGFLLMISVIISFLSITIDRSHRKHFEDYVMACHHTVESWKTRKTLEGTLKALLPETALQRLEKNEPVLDVATVATISICEIYDFGNWAATVMPATAVQAVNALVSAFSASTASYKVRELKVSGDKYFCGTGLLTDSTLADASRVVHFAFLQMHFAGVLNAKIESPVSLRCAIHTGTFCGAIVGSDSLTYNLFGEAVQVAQEILQAAIKGSVLISANTYAVVHRSFAVYEGPQVSVGCEDLLVPMSMTATPHCSVNDVVKDSNTTFLNSAGGVGPNNSGSEPNSLADTYANPTSTHIPPTTVPFNIAAALSTEETTRRGSGGEVEAARNVSVVTPGSVSGASVGTQAPGSHHHLPKPGEHMTSPMSQHSVLRSPTASGSPTTATVRTYYIVQQQNTEIDATPAVFPRQQIKIGRSLGVSRRTKLLRKMCFRFRKNTDPLFNHFNDMFYANGDKDQRSREQRGGVDSVFAGSPHLENNHNHHQWTTHDEQPQQGYNQFGSGGQRTGSFRHSPGTFGDEHTGLRSPHVVGSLPLPRSRSGHLAAQLQHQNGGYRTNSNFSGTASVTGSHLGYSGTSAVDGNESSWGSVMHPVQQFRRLKNRFANMPPSGSNTPSQSVGGSSSITMAGSAPTAAGVSQLHAHHRAMLGGGRGGGGGGGGGRSEYSNPFLTVKQQQARRRSSSRNHNDNLMPPSPPNQVMQRGSHHSIASESAINPMLPPSAKTSATVTMDVNTTFSLSPQHDTDQQRGGVHDLTTAADSGGDGRQENPFDIFATAEDYVRNARLTLRSQKFEMAPCVRFWDLEFVDAAVEAMYKRYSIPQAAATAKNVSILLFCVGLTLLLTVVLDNSIAHDEGGDYQPHAPAPIVVLIAVCAVAAFRIWYVQRPECNELNPFKATAMERHSKRKDGSGGVNGHGKRRQSPRSSGQRVSNIGRMRRSSGGLDRFEPLSFPPPSHPPNAQANNTSSPDGAGDGGASGSPLGQPHFTPPPHGAHLQPINVPEVTSSSHSNPTHHQPQQQHNSHQHSSSTTFGESQQLPNSVSSDHPQVTIAHAQIGGSNSSSLPQGSSSSTHNAPPGNDTGSLQSDTAPPLMSGSGGPTTGGGRVMHHQLLSSSSSHTPHSNSANAPQNKKVSVPMLPPEDDVNELLGTSDAQLVIPAAAASNSSNSRRARPSPINANNPINASVAAAAGVGGAQVASSIPVHSPSSPQQQFQQSSPKQKKSVQLNKKQSMSVLHRPKNVKYTAMQFEWVIICLLSIGFTSATFLLQDSVHNGNFTYLTALFSMSLALSFGRTGWYWIVPCLTIFVLALNIGAQFWRNGMIWPVATIAEVVVVVVCGVFAFNQEMLRREIFVWEVENVLEVHVLRDALAMQEALINLTTPVPDLAKKLLTADKAEQSPLLRVVSDCVALDIAIHNLRTELPDLYNDPVTAFRKLDELFLGIDLISSHCKALRRVHTCGDKVRFAGPLIGDDDESLQPREDTGVESGSGEEAMNYVQDLPGSPPHPQQQQQFLDEGPSFIVTSTSNGNVQLSSNNTNDFYLQMEQYSNNGGAGGGGAASNDGASQCSHTDPPAFPSVGGGSNNSAFANPMMQDLEPSSSEPNSPGLPVHQQQQRRHVGGEHPYRGGNHHQAHISTSPPPPHSIPHSNNPTTANVLAAPPPPTAQNATKKDHRREALVVRALADACMLLSNLKQISEDVTTTAVAVVDPAFVVFMGAQSLLTFDVMGVAVRRSAALLHAAPPYFIGCSQSFMRVVEDHPESLGALYGELFSTQSHPWKVRGYGVARMFPLLSMEEVEKQQAGYGASNPNSSGGGLIGGY